MDKAGHVMTAYYVGKIGIDLLKWSGVDRKSDKCVKAVWYGGALGFLLQSTVEVLDGFSADWGASTGDIIANVAGSAIVIGEELAWQEQRILIKFSFHQTPVSKHRPQLLGANLSENILKDYNGQTYWLSCNLSSFLKEGSKFPKWFNIALGYGAYGMTGGTTNPTDVDGVPIPEFERYRRFLLTADIDLTRLKTRFRFLNTCLSTFGFLKFPFPSVEFNKEDGVKFYPLYF